ncbi:hypothetical protein AAG570_000458 [Ranatra chinensis]|uniref:C2H2-type domain-containing protein n=1 Tax=Ranatra chinensis TaxID=642074 RepID=A0ABD0ZIA9_9HEMI
MVTSDDDEDTHFCLKCRTTILGLENYVVHRKSKSHNEDTLRADDFFSSLNLQSSSKPTVAPPVPTGGREGGHTIRGIVTRSKTGSSKRKLTSGGKWKAPGWAGSWEEEPPPGHTGGKWRPTETIAGSQSSSLYWCGPCHRRLSSSLLYDRHLKSELHFKRTHQERQLEGPDHRRPVRSTRLTLPRYSKLKSQEMRLKKRRERRGCRRGEVVCQVCLCKVKSHKMGKHLVSHYHCSRHPRNSEQARDTILNYMPSIVRQAPFQCHMCKFYCNTVETFIAHWASDLHRQNDLAAEGTFWCLFCKYATESSVAMGCHLVGEAHREVVIVINRSMPIVIQKRLYVHCDVCRRGFRYNAQLRRHARRWGHDQPASTASDQYQELAECSQCDFTAHSLSSFQKHVRSKHGLKGTTTGHYFCRVCDLRFDTLDESKRHRNEASHRYKTAVVNARDKKSLRRSCHHCRQVFDQLADLKTHLQLVHPDQTHR